MNDYAKTTRLRIADQMLTDSTILSYLLEVESSLSADSV
jgi:hypothetical protein